MSTLVQPAINLIKSNKIAEAYPLLMTVVSSLISRDAKAIVLGCTEIPLAIRETISQNIPLINSIDSLVLSTINWYQKTME